ncbi:MAG: nucleoside recognition protein [Clostridia bacterium]|nr:nucleoside recognition protein [Clostridia bacterium]MBQ9758133.1 nucleoside recognition protein [Clostridia bacterium]
MLNFIWGGMVIISFIVAALNGRIDALTASALEGAASGIETCIGLLGTMCLWTGLAKIAENSGLNQIFAKLLRPFTKLLFPRLDKNSAALKAIVLNMVANLLGMGNAATPLGICAMRELDKENKHRGTASYEMCMFAVLNTASIQLIPSTVISLRQMYGSQNPSEIVFPIWICSSLAVIMGVTAAKFFEKYGRNRL